MKSFKDLVSDLYGFAEKESNTNSQAEWMAWLRNHEDDAIEMLFSNYARTSRRTKLLVFAIAAGLNRKQADQLLSKYRRERLYVRNIADVAIMRALDCGYTMEQLDGLVHKLGLLIDQIPRHSSIEKELTIQTMWEYLGSWNEQSESSQDTLELTNELQNIYDESSDMNDDQFVDMIRDNIQYFTTVRERTRREYVRYLYEYAKHVAEHGNKNDRRELFFNSDGKKEENPGEWPISLLNLGFDINEFYLGGLYDVKEHTYLPEDHRDFEPKASKEEKREWLERSGSQEDIDQLKQKERFDAVIRKFLRGNCDIGRTLFISNVLFFDFKTTGTINVQRLNNVLYKCGWNEIDYSGRYDFDRMIVDMLDYYNEKRFIYSDFMYMIFEDLEDPVFAEYHENYQDLQGNQTINDSMYKLMMKKGKENGRARSASAGNT